MWIIVLWTWVYRCLFETLFSILFHIYPEVKLLNFVTILLLIFWGTTIFPIATALYCIPTDCRQGFQFLFNLINPYQFLSFFDSSWVWLLGMTSSWREIFSSHCLSFSQVVLLVSLGILLCILDINSSSDIWFAKVFSHSIDCLFHSVDPLSFSC